MPDEIAELRELLETALVALAAAEDDRDAAIEELNAAQDACWDAQRRAESALVAQQAANRNYLDSLKRHGYKQTADGPKRFPVDTTAMGLGGGSAAADVPLQRPLAHSGLWPNPPIDASQLAIWAARPETGSGPQAGKATGTGGQVEIQCCGVWIDYPTPGQDTSCGECGSTFTVGDSQLAVIGATGDPIPVTTSPPPHHLYERLEGDRPGAPCRVDDCGQPKSAEVHQVRL